MSRDQEQRITFDAQALDPGAGKASLLIDEQAVA